MRARRSPPPFWFLLCVAVVAAWVFRCHASTGGWGAGGGGHAEQVQYGFFAFILGLVSIIFRGLEVAGKVALTILQWSVKLLWLFATATSNAVKALGLLVRDGLWKAWDFFRLTYDHVLKPVWSKFWRWFDNFRRWLDDTFGPVLRWLRRLRDTLMRFWATYVRPILDIIDATRRILRVLSSLGLHWAAELDAKLGALEDAIERPFRLLLAKLNEVINIVNGIVDGFGLFQRVVLIRSLERDMRFAWRAAVNWRASPVDAATVSDTQKRIDERTIDQVEADTRAALVDQAGPYEAWALEMAATVSRYLS